MNKSYFFTNFREKMKEKNEKMNEKTKWAESTK